MSSRASSATLDPLTPASHLSPDPCVVSVVHGDDTVLLHAETGRYFSLNAAGGVLWAAICDEEPLSSPIDRLQAQFPADSARIEGDILALATDLTKAALAHVISVAHGT